ncbi:MAG: DNA polymerase III subunit gamma/tau [Bacteroidota bacterium]
MSNFIVSARKYRPARFDEVVGQGHVSGTLKNALQNNHLAHAFLFCGPRGVGKTTCARILAKVLNCENLTSDHEACNECPSCSAFNDNASFNITELDAASNNSVEHIRALIEQVRFQPQQGKYKVFIIDEVHMLSQQAFNAFLKTLEEPPSYAIFILATTEKHKIIPTILSRCQIFDFRRIQVPDMVEHLQDICQQESIQADRDALHIVAQKADGALRDALSIFDRIVSFSGKEIKYEDVIENLNVLDYDYFFKLVEAMLVEDLATVMLTFDDILRKGFEPAIFINGLAEHLRNVLVCKDTQTLQLLEVSEGLKDRYQQQANLSPSSYLLTALNIANDCDVNYRMARNKRLHVEMALVKMTYIMRAVKLQANPGAMAAAPEKKKSESASLNVPEGKTPEVPIPSQPVTPESPSSAVPKPESELSVPKISAQLKVGKELKVDSEHNAPRILSLDKLEEEIDHSEQNQADQISKLTSENLNRAWNDYVAQVQSPSVRNTLRNAELRIENKEVIASVGSQMAKGLIQDETELMPFVRQQLNDKGLSLRVDIDAKKAPKDLASKPKRLIGNREKFEKMKSINPLVDELRKRFDLLPDND